MSEREQAKRIIDRLPDYKISYLLLFLKGMEFDDELEMQFFPNHAQADA
jgi:hypothetical protein